MADNISVAVPTSGTTATIATDEVVDDTLGTVKVQYVKLMDGTLNGTSKALIDASGLKVNLGADNDVTVTAATDSIGKAEDVASAGADVGVPAMAVQKATPANTAGTDGDYEMLQMSTGRLWVSAKIDTALPAGTAAIGKLAANSGVDIGDVDVISILPGTGALNLGKIEDEAHASGDVGVMTLAVRRDANTTLVASDGDYAPLQVTDAGSLKVAITEGAGSGGTSIADEAAFTQGSTSVTPIAGLYVSSEDALSTGQVAAIGIDVARNVKTHEQYAPVAEDNNNGVIAVMHKPFYGSAYSATPFAIFGTDVDLAVKTSAGNIYSIVATNINAAVRYIQIHNKASAPAGADVPILSLPIPAGTSTAPSERKYGSEIFGANGLYLSTGVSVGISTTEATFTAATTTDHDYFGLYK